MAVTTQMRTQVTQLYVSLFGRAPEASGLGYWVSQLSAGKSFQTVAQDMFNVDASRVTYPTYLTNEEIVAKFYVNVLGRTADAGGLAYWTGRLNTESTTGTAASKMIAVGTVITEMLTAVVAYNGTDAAGLQSQSLFNNKVAVGLHYAVDLGGNDIPFASTLMPMVSSGPTGANAALAAIDSTLAASLTNGIDNLTANVFTSVPVYTPGGNDFINSLQDEDRLTGTGVNPTLNATLGSVNDAAESVIVPKMSGVQTANFEITGNAGGVNFQDTTGLTNLNINRITQTNASVTMTDLDVSTNKLSVSNATRDGSVSFLYKEDNLLGTSDEVTLNLSNTRLKALTINETGDSGEDQGYGFETVNVNVLKSSNIDKLTIGANTREDVSTANASQTVNIVASATTEINSLIADGAETINLTANADVLIAADERNILRAANDGISTADLTKLTITGAGNVTIDGLNGNINEKATVNGEKGTTLVVDASAMTGALKLGVATAADGNSSGTWGNHTDKDVSITSGSGNDIIETYTALAGDITTGAGNDQVLINDGGATATYTNVEGVSTINTGTGNDTVRAANLLATAADAADGNVSFGQVTAASIVTGDGDDTVAVLALGSAVDTDNGNLKDSNVDDTYFVKGASVDTGAGNDAVSFTTVAEGASVSTGEGDDSITVELVGGTILAGDDTSKAEVNLDKSANALGAIVDLGAGDDTADFYQEDTTGGAVATTIVGLDAELRAGAGNDVLNVSALDAVTVNVNTTWTTKADDTNANIIGVETANFTVLDQIDAATETATDYAQNDDNEADGSITADVMRFDSALKAINLNSQEDTLLQTAVTEIYRAGTATTFTLNNMREEVALTLKANEATGVDGDGALKDDQVVDVNLNVNMASARGAADTFTLNIAEGSGAFDLNLNLGATLTDKVGNDASKTDDDDMRVENVVVKLAADDKGHYINFNGFGDAPHTDAPEEGSKTAVTSLTVNGGVAGTKLVLDNVSADTITAAGAADVKLKLNGSNNFTVTTGSGNDVINMMSDDVRANDVTDDAADDNSVDATDEADAVNAGAGNDRIIINGGDNLGIYTGVAQRTDDDVFNKIKSVESIEIQGGGTNVVILDEAAATTGANLQNIYLTGANAQTTTIQIGENFVNDSGTVKNTLTIDSTKDLSKDFGATAKDGALTLNIENQDTDQDIDLINLNVIVGMEKGTDLNFDNTGDNGATVTVTATVAKNVANTVASGLAANAGNLSIDITKGSIDKVVLLDSANNTKLGDKADNGNITVTVDNSWSKTAIEFDASGIMNNDAGAGVDGGAAIEELEGTTGQAQVAGIQGPRDTGGMTFNGAGELDAKLTVKGTQNDDSITGSNQDDTLAGNDGDDLIIGGNGADMITGGNGNDDIRGGVGKDTIDAGAGDDAIFGELGADTLTGGAGKDTFKYTAVTDSNGDGADLITDFATADDTIVIDAVVAGDGSQNFINLASFATVATAGDGDNSLLGNSGGAANAVMGDAYFATDSGQLVIDVDGNGDITTGADIVIKSTGTINASNINYNINAGAGDDFIRGGQGADDLNGGAGADTFVLVGTLTDAEASAYSAAYVAGGNVASAVVGASLAAVENKVLRASELFSARSITEVNKGDKINSAGNDATDVAHVFGTVDGSLINGGAAFNVGAVIVHSTLTMTLAQLQALQFVIFDGNAPHTIIVKNNDGTAMSQAAQEAAILAATVYVTNNGSLTTISIGSGTAMTAAAFQGAGYVNPPVSTTVAGLAGLVAGVPYSLNDTAANLAAATATQLNGAINITSTDAATVAQATVIEAATNSGVNTYNITDTAAVLAASTNAVLTLAGTVTANTTATAAQATAIAAFAKAVVYSVSDTSAALAAAVAGMNEAVNITATDAATVAQATAIEAATNTGTNTYNIADTAAALAASTNAVLNLAGTVTATTTATAVEATAIAAFAKAVVYSVSDTAAALAAAGSGLSEAVNITATTAATVSQAAVIEAASNTGTNTYDITDTVAFLVAAGNAVLTLAGTVTASNAATAAEATTLAGFAKAVVYNIVDSVANIVAAAGAGLNEAVNITATTNATIAQATTIEAATNTGTNTYNISDTSANIAASSNALLDLVAGSVNTTDAATVAQATTIEAFNKVVAIDSLTDTATAIAASSNAVLNQVTNAVSATGTATVAEATAIEAFTKAVSIAALSDTSTAVAASSNAVLDQVAGAVSATGTATVAEATTIEAFTKAVSIAALTDTATAVSASSNAVLDQVTGVVTATGIATVAQATTIEAFSKSVSIDALTDTAAAVAASSNAVLDQVTGVVTATGISTVAQATTIEAFTKVVSIDALTDTVAAVAASSNAVLDQVTGAVSATGTAIVAEATTIEAFNHAVAIAALSDTATAIAASSNAVLDQVTGAVAATGTATVAEATTIEAFTHVVTVAALTDTAAALAASSNAVLDQVTGVVTASVAADTTEAAAIAGFTKAVTFNISDTAADLATLFNAGTSLAVTEAGAFTSDGTVTVTGAGMTTLANATGALSSHAVIVDGANETVNLGSLAAFGGNGVITFGDAAGTDTYTVNLINTSVTTINLLGTGNHDVTAAAANIETFVLGAAYDGGVVLRGMGSGDKIDVSVANALTAFTLQTVNAGDVNAAGEWHFASQVLTYWDDVAMAAKSIVLVGVTNVSSDNVDTFTVV